MAKAAFASWATARSFYREHRFLATVALVMLAMSHHAWILRWPLAVAASSQMLAPSLRVLVLMPTSQL
jgi:hypothetical protein